MKIQQLKAREVEYGERIRDINQWLLTHFDHPDRAKYHNDKAYYQCELQLLRRKIKNLEAGLPENGYGEGISDQPNSKLKK